MTVQGWTGSGILKSGGVKKIAPITTLKLHPSYGKIME